MDERFREVVDSLHPAYEKLIAAEPITNAKFPNVRPKRAVYLFSEGNRPLYVGRTNNLRNRYGGHTRPSSKHYSAPFAFKLARQGTGKLEPAYTSGENSRNGLMLDREFAAAFSQAKERILRMDFRYVEESDPTRQALLEAYCCIVLQTPYNDFENH